MNGFTTVGHCPKCGAPIYSPTIWHGITPPPVTYTCDCNPQANATITTTTSSS
jgi:hypothetical protein